MEYLVQQNNEIINRAYNKASELIKKIYNLEYFDKTNYEKNIKDLGFSIINDDNNYLFTETIAVFYSPQENKIFIDESLMNEGLLSEEVMGVVMLHELLHMASTNRKNYKSGFNHKALPITYNEGCTQYLAIKLYYDDLEKGIETNSFYPESTKAIKHIVDLLGENKIFNGYFTADPRKAADGLSPKELDTWVDTIMVLQNSLEEKQVTEHKEEEKDVLVR